MHKSMKTLLAAAFSIGLATPMWAADADTVVASVNDQPITLGHMIVMVAQLPEEYQSLPDDVLYDAVLDQLIKQSAVAQTMEGKLSKSARLALENEQRSFLAGEALTLSASQAVTDEAVQALYDERFANAAAEQEFRASHILLETEEKAKEVKELVAGGADFADMAREHSTGPSGPSGGELGWFGKGMMVQPFEEAVLALSAGEVSDPVQTQFGWHLVLLHETREKPAPTLEELRPQIEGELQQAAISAALEEMTAAASVDKSEEEIDPALLRNIELLQN